MPTRGYSLPRRACGDSPVELVTLSVERLAAAVGLRRGGCPRPHSGPTFLEGPLCELFVGAHLALRRASCSRLSVIVWLRPGGSGSIRASRPGRPSLSRLRTQILRRTCRRSRRPPIGRGVRTGGERRCTVQDRVRRHWWRGALPVSLMVDSRISTSAASDGNQAASPFHSPVTSAAVPKETLRILWANSGHGSVSCSYLHRARTGLLGVCTSGCIRTSLADDIGPYQSPTVSHKAENVTADGVTSTRP